MGEVGETIVNVATGGMYDLEKGRFQAPFSKGFMGSPAFNIVKDFGGSMLGGLVDFHKGRAYVPFSSGHMRNLGKSYANVLSAGLVRKQISTGLDSQAGRIAGAVTGIAAGAGVGGAVGGAASGTGIGSAVGSSTSTGAGLGLLAASAAQADAFNKQAPELKVEPPVDSANTAVQRAVSEAASRRSRGRSQRSTILSQNFLSPSNPALKQTFGS
jgi:hypothetical protein